MLNGHKVNIKVIVIIDEIYNFAVNNLFSFEDSLECQTNNIRFTNI
jgi:hypothetical protein